MPPSSPTPSPPTPSSPGMGQPSTPSSSAPSGQESDRQQQQQAAAEALKKAGQQVASQGEQLSDPSDQPGAAGEWDPLIPDSEQMTDSESDTFMESEASAASSSDSAAQNSADASSGGSPSDMSDDTGPETAASTSGEPDDMMMEDDLADASIGSPASGGQLSEEIRAAQEALEEAGIALQTAGATLETAQSDQELAEAEAALGRARLAVIIAGQDLMDIRNADITPVQEDIFAESEQALNDANVAIVIATDTIFSTRLELPDFDPAQAGGAEASGRGGELDEALNESIVVFEGKILDAREEVLGSTPPPSSSANIPGVAVLGGTGSEGEGEPGMGSLEENGEGIVEVGVPGPVQQGNLPEGGELASAETGPMPPIPEDIPSPQGDDIVAQQLREAAVAETDPELQAKLWEEYRKYRAGL